MQFQSTRDPSHRAGLGAALRQGLAPDGGLYVPVHWPDRSHELAAAPDTLRGIAEWFIAPFASGDALAPQLAAITTEAFNFPAPRVELDAGDHYSVLELFHGPTLAFKDVALQLVGRMFDYVLAQRGQRITIVGATSGDTGSAAIDAVKQCRNVDIVILYPAGRTSDVQRWSYVGPGGGSTGDWGDYPSSFIHDPSNLGPSYTSINANGGPKYVNTTAIGQLFLSNPEYFVPAFTAAQYYNATYANTRRFKEDVPAAYVMANSAIGPFALQAGLRWEGTRTNSEEFDPLLPSEVKAAGYAVDANGRATTVAGLDYQFASKPKVNRKGNYDRLFPSVSAKYRLSENWIFDIGAGQTIRRPEVVKLVGLYTINEDAEIITAANPALLPEYAERVAASASYYFGGTNNVTLTLSDTNIENLFISDEFTAEEFGIDDPQLDTYTVRSFRNSGDAIRFRSLELAYRQSLSFLPGILQGTSVFANYTRTYADGRRPGLTPHVVSGGVDWRYKRLGFGLKGVWSDDAPWTSTDGRYRPAVLKLDGSIDVRLADGVTAFIQVRNLTNEDHVIVEAIGDNIPVVWRRENYGSNTVIGVRGTF